ncbi:MAG: guanylate kinase [Acutalibacteraceae bacterium]|nr:guanylate kinase [Acutalibacteraceae bacterium]
MNKGTIIVFSGPSGVGKGTVLNELLKDKDEFALSISATTRSPRKGEVDGVNYFFLSKEEFLNKVSSDSMLEYAQYCENFYGTPKAYVEENINSGKNVILEIDVQGALQVKKNKPEAVSVFIMPPSIEVLEKRLRGRGTDEEEVIQKRLAIAINEIKQAEKYDYIVINDELNDCINDIKTIINAEKMKIYNMIDFVKGVLD